MAGVKRRILTITAGAAGMYCGSCARDNALASELLARGHDITLLPVYTPTRTDETNVSRPQVLFGGISIYLQQYVSLFRHLPRLFDRLWDSPRVLRAVAGRAMSTDARCSASSPSRCWRASAVCCAANSTSCWNG
jgi:hypothetical protein